MSLLLDLIGVAALISPVLVIALIFLVLIFLAGIKVIVEYERGVKFRFGRYVGIMNPGLNYVIPFIEGWIKIDTRVFTVDIPSQEVMTKDNIPVNINAVIYYRVKDPEKAVLIVKDYSYAISKYAQTSLRNVVGEVELDELLSKREQIASELRRIVDAGTDPWGLDVPILELQDIKLPENMKRVIARQAEAERERRSRVIMADGEYQAAAKMAEAAKLYAENPIAVKLREFQMLSEVAREKNLIVIAPSSSSEIATTAALVEGMAKKKPRG